MSDEDWARRAAATWRYSRKASNVDIKLPGLVAANKPSIHAWQGWRSVLGGVLAVCTRARPEDYPINDDNSPIKVVNFNGVGGSTVMYTAHFPRLHPSDFKVKTLDGVADDWPIDYGTLVPFFAENDRMMGVSGLSGDPA